MEDDNLLAEVRIRSVIRMERSWRSGKRMTDASAYTSAYISALSKILFETIFVHYVVF